MSLCSKKKLTKVMHSIPSSLSPPPMAPGPKAKPCSLPRPLDATQLRQSHRPMTELSKNDFQELTSPVLGGRQHVHERERLPSYVEVRTHDNKIIVWILMPLRK